jgi:hypothetical protein
VTDLLIDWMERHGVPISREKYLALAYGKQLPDPWTYEHELELPKQIRLDDLPDDEGSSP